MLAQSAFLLPFVPEELGQGEPFDRLLIAPFMGGNHPRQAGRHLRPQRNVPLTLVPEVIELADDFLAAFGSEELQGLKRRAIVLAEAVAAGDRTPVIKNILPRVAAPQAGLRQRFGIKVAKA